MKKYLFAILILSGLTASASVDFNQLINDSKVDQQNAHYNLKQSYDRQNTNKIDKLLNEKGEKLERISASSKN